MTRWGTYRAPSATAPGQPNGQSGPATVSAFLRGNLPPKAIGVLKQVRLHTAYRLNPRGRWGGLRRTSPFSDNWGRGGSVIDRFYIDRFLERHRDDIKGRVLEVDQPRYARALGGEHVVYCEVVDVDSSNAEATIIGDLSEEDVLAADRFDCFIMTQTLQYMIDPSAAVRNAYRTLRPGGFLLVTAPCISRIDPVAQEYPYGDRWRLTPGGLAGLLQQVFPPERVQVEGFGNVLSAVAFLMALGAAELRPSELEVNDPDFPVVACGRAQKP